VTRVLVIATSAILRAGLEALVKESPSLELAGSAQGLATLAKQIAGSRPDVILLELDSLDEEAKESLLGGAPGDLSRLPVVALAEDFDGTSTAQLLRSGVRAVLPRNSSPLEITAALEAAAAGLLVLHPDAAEWLLPAMSSAVQARPSSRSEVLTARELEVLRMMAEGLGNKIIADRLGISEHTVKFHIASIFTKLDVSSRTEAVTVGVREGLILL
jgi:two-component system, NarL family, response regulator YdfI